MAKKKKQTNNSLKALGKTFRNNPVLWAALGGAAGGALITAAIQSSRGQNLIGSVSSSLQDLMPNKYQPQGTATYTEFTEPNTAPAADQEPSAAAAHS